MIPRTPDSRDVAQLLATLERIPRSELPDGACRTHLVECIREGLIDNVYRPLGADYHNITWATRQPWIDPRQRITDFLASFIGYTKWARAHNVTPVTPKEAAHDAE